MVNEVWKNLENRLDASIRGKWCSSRTFLVLQYETMNSSTRPYKSLKGEFSMLL